MSIFILLLICHVIGDYFLQSEEMAKNKTNEEIPKKESTKWMIAHDIMYIIPFFVLTIVFWISKVMRPEDAAGILLAVFIQHAAIDCLKKHLNKIIGFLKSRLPKKIIDGIGKYPGKLLSAEGWSALIYFGDQILHITVLWIIFCCITRYNLINYNSIIEMLKSRDPFLIKYKLYLKWALYILILLKPANITFVEVFSRFRHTQDDPEDETIKGAGAAIGNLERLLMGILIYFGQYAAVGLTVTAKSVARFDKLSKDQSFAEYYLIGTLFSVLYTLVFYYLVFKIL